MLPQPLQHGLLELEIPFVGGKTGEIIWVPSPSSDEGLESPPSFPNITKLTSIKSRSWSRRTRGIRPVIARTESRWSKPKQYP
jgi:hypothetical protein